MSDDEFARLSNVLGADAAAKILAARSSNDPVDLNFASKTMAILEGERRRNHHEVLCLVLKELVDSALILEPAECVERARLFADLAYPPPKQEPSE